MKLNRLLLVGLLTVLPTIVFAMGAIAIDDEVGDEDPGYGISTGMASKEAASKDALAQCKKAGNDNCKVKVWFNGCGAYATSKNFYGVGYGATKKVAESKALSECGKSSCEVKVSECDE